MPLLFANTEDRLSHFKAHILDISKQVHWQTMKNYHKMLHFNKVCTVCLNKKQSSWTEIHRESYMSSNVLLNL